MTKLSRNVHCWMQRLEWESAENVHVYVVFDLSIFCSYCLQTTTKPSYAGIFGVHLDRVKTHVTDKNHMFLAEPRKHINQAVG